MTTWEEKFLRFVAERWVFKGTDPHDFRPRIVLMGFGEDFISPLLKRHEHFGALYTGYLGQRFVGYMRVPPGTVILEGVVRSLALTRADTIIGLGTCGGLREEIQCGDIIIADGAQAGDALSPHYGFKRGQVIPADAALSESIAGYFRRRALPVHKGPIVTTGAIFRETEELIASWNQDGFLGVELEASGLFALTNFLGMKATMALLVTDSPIRQETSDVLHSKKRKAFIEGVTNFLDSPNV